MDKKDFNKRLAVGALTGALAVGTVAAGVVHNSQQ